MVMTCKYVFINYSKPIGSAYEQFIRIIPEYCRTVSVTLIENSVCDDSFSFKRIEKRYTITIKYIKLTYYPSG